MCSPASCQRCDKVTWRGCGRHVDQVMSRVAPANRCTCGAAGGDVQASPRRRGLFRR